MEECVKGLEWFSPMSIKYFYKLTSPNGIGILNGEEDDRSEPFDPGRGITGLGFD